MKRRIFKRLISVILILSMISINFIFVSANSSKQTYKVNENGETYGNDIQAMTIGYEPDLIYAQGIDGTLGYVKASDLSGNEKSPAEALQKQMLREKSDSAMYIPLYMSDGETIIGSFKLENTIPVTDSIIKQSNVGLFAAPSGYAYGVAYNVTCSGITFSIKSGVKGESTGIRAVSYIQANSGTAPAGYMGAQARIYKYDTGALVKSSNWEYTKTAQSSFYVETFWFSVTNSAYYSKGLTREFNTAISDYWTHTTNASPNATPG